MHPIPPKIRERLAADSFMARCIRRNADCSGRVEWEHAWIYAGKQIQEEWAIVPCCEFHHRGEGLDKEFNEYASLLRATPEDLAKYPNKNWQQKLTYLKKKYEKVYSL